MKAFIIGCVVVLLAAMRTAAADDQAIKQDFVLCGMQQDLGACDRLVNTAGLSNTIRANAYATRAGTFMRMGRIDAAKADFDKAHSLDPGNALVQRGQALLEQVKPGNDKVAFLACMHEIDLAAKLKACSTLVESGKFDAQGKAAAFELRAKAFVDSGRFDEALADLDAADRLAPQRQDAALHRVQTLTFAGRYPAALEMVRAALAKSGATDAELLHAEANLLYLTGKLEEAVTAYEATYRLRPDAVMAKFWSAIIRLELHQSASSDLQNLLGHPMMSPLGAAIIRMRLHQAGQDPVLSEAKLSGQTAPCIAYFNIGHDAWLRGAIPEARQALQKAVEAGTNQQVEYQAAKAVLSRLPGQ